nr:hypothetical protein [Tanacetum cinerariifolium]
MIRDAVFTFVIRYMDLKRKGNCLMMTKKPFNNNNERATDLLGLIHTDVYGPLRHVSKKELQLGKKIKALRSDRGGEYLSQEFKDYLKFAVRILNMVLTKKGCKAYVKCDSADKLQQRSVKCIFVRYPKETIGYYFYFPSENKVIVARYGNFLERDLISQRFSRRDNDLEDDHMDTLPSEN